MIEKKIISFFFVLLLFLSSTIALQQVELEIFDIDEDDGSGLTLSWYALAPEYRVIEYRIYRGTCTERLFYIGKIDVNPEIDFTGRKLFYYDRDFNDFVSIDSPAKLRKELQQSIDSPLYQSMPRDLDIYSSYLNKYSVLGIIEKKQFYYRAENISDSEGNSMAGLFLRQFDGLFSSLMPGQEYFYSVVPVNEQRRFLNRSEIVKGIAIDNPPEKIHNFSAVLVKDKSRIQFEWDLPLFTDDIYSHNIYMLKDEDLVSFDNYLANLSELQKIKEKKQIDPTLLIPETFIDLVNPAILIEVVPSSFPYSSLNTTIVQVHNGIIYNEHYGINVEVDFNDILKYNFIFSLKDYSGFETFTEPVRPFLVNSSDLPVLPNFQVIDQKNDQGDYLDIQIGKPIVFLTNANFVNQKRDRLIINYDFSESRDHTIKKVYFEFYDMDNNFISRLEEFFLDKIVYLNLNNENIAHQGINVIINYETSGSILDKEINLEQQIKYNPVSQFFEIGNLFLNGENLNNYNYYLYKRAKSDRDFRFVRRISPFIRLFEDNIPYERYIFKMVNNYDLESGKLLVDNKIDITFDRERDINIVTNIFFEEIENDVKFYQNILSDLNSELNTSTDKEKDVILEEIDFYTKFLDMYVNHPILTEANKIQNNRKRMKYLSEIREKHKRTFEYFLVKSESQAFYTQSEIYEENGKNFFFPKPDWFNTEKYPMLFATLIFGFLVYWLIRKAQKGDDMFIRHIAGLEEIDNAIGRATEMGRPILFVPGLSTIDEIATLAGLQILGHISRRTAEYDTRIIVPVCDYIVLPIAMEIVKEAYYSAGKSDAYSRDDIFFIAEGQFAYVAGVNGVMLRQKTAANFYMGVFFAEALIMTETGNSFGSIQIAGSDALTQIPFFITTCDYTLIGEELYGASAYLSREPLIMGTLKAQDYAKILIVLFIVIGSIMSTFRLTFIINSFPSQ